MKAAATQLPAPSDVAGASGTGAPASKGGVDAKVAGQAGEGAKLLGGGPTSLAAVLQQLSDAVKALAAAVQGIRGGGPSPVQVGQGPGQVGQLGGPDGMPDMGALLSTRLERALAKPNLSAEAKAALEALRPAVAAARAEQAQFGAASPVTHLRISLQIDRAIAPDAEVRAKVDQVIAKTAGIEQGGMINPARLVGVGIEAGMASGRIGREQLPVAQRLLGELAQMEQGGSFNPVALQRISLEAHVAAGRILPGKEADAAQLVAELKAQEHAPSFDPLRLQQASLRFLQVVDPHTPV